MLQSWDNTWTAPPLTQSSPVLSLNVQLTIFNPVPLTVKTVFVHSLKIILCISISLARLVIVKRRLTNVVLLPMNLTNNYLTANNQNQWILIKKLDRGF